MNTAASLQRPTPKIEARTSMKPITKPPIAAPVMLPMPPRTAAVNALRPAWKPMLNTVTPKYRPWTTPAAPASAEPMKNTRAIVELMFTPMIWAASRSIAVERIARPVFVRWMNSCSAVIRTSERTITNRLIWRIEIGPIVDHRVRDDLGDA